MSDLDEIFPFTVVFYGLRIFCRKTAQFCVTRCECGIAEIPSIREAVQRSENMRKNSFFNYELTNLSHPDKNPTLNRKNPNPKQITHTMKKHILRPFALILIALALPLTAANATSGLVDLNFSPGASAAASPGSSVTLSLSMDVAGFSDPDRVGGFGIQLTSLNSSTGQFFIQSRTTDTAGFFPDPIVNDGTVAARPGSDLNPTNNSDLGQTVNNLQAVSNGTYHLANYVIGIDAGVAPGVYDFVTTVNTWTDQNGDPHTGMISGLFRITVTAVPEPATWSLLGLGAVASVGMTLLRRRKA